MTTFTVTVLFVLQIAQFIQCFYNVEQRKQPDTTMSEWGTVIFLFLFSHDLGASASVDFI